MSEKMAEIMGVKGHPGGVGNCLGVVPMHGDLGRGIGHRPLTPQRLVQKERGTGRTEVGAIVEGLAEKSGGS